MIILFDPADGLPVNLDSAHALLIRTVTSINKRTLSPIPENLQFVGTGSSGTDHVDITYLKNNGISFADAAGCNARSVAEYVATTLLMWADKTGQNLTNLSVGVVGVGHVGSQVIQQLDKLGISTISYDPPRENRDPDFSSADLEEVLSCPIITFHTPLIHDGTHPTYHWLDEQKLTGRSFELIINTARGGIIDEESLLTHNRKGSVKDFIIDVWEDEPDLHNKTAEKAFIKTPHIAGYSVQAKENASKFVAEAMFEHFNIPESVQKKQENPAIHEGDISTFDSLSSMLSKLHPVKEYEKELNQILHNHSNDRGAFFNRLRATFPLRQEFAQTYLLASYFERFPILQKLGFSLRRAASK